jgi:4-azaleucine resistance transporter AzlC
MKTHREEFAQGVTRGIPIAVGYLPIAMAFGVLAREAHLSTHEAVLMSGLVFAGASQFMAASMVLAGAGGVQIILATLFVNLRHLIMSMAVHDRLCEANAGWRALVSFGITDETFALLTLANSAEQARVTPYFSSGLMGIAYLGWVLGTAVGALGARYIPPQVSTAMTMGLYAMFIGLLTPHVRQSLRIGLIAGLSMILNTALGTVWTPGWSIVWATIGGASLGVLLKEEPC